MDQQLLNKYCDITIGLNWMHSHPVSLSGWEVAEALWPLNQYFRPHYQQFAGLPYNPAFEKQADIAQKRFVFEGMWGPVSVEAWRVILERQQQTLVVALANEVDGNHLMPVPHLLPKQAYTGFAVLFWLQGMKLPFPASDRSNYSPDAPMPGR